MKTINTIFNAEGRGKALINQNGKIQRCSKPHVNYLQYNYGQNNYQHPFNSISRPPCNSLDRLIVLPVIVLHKKIAAVFRLLSLSSFFRSLLCRSLSLFHLRYPQSRFHNVYPLLLLLSAVLLSSCAVGGGFPGFPRGVDPDRAWPPPPEPPRVAHVMDIRQHQDLFAEKGLWKAIVALAGGERDSTLSRPMAVAVHPRGGLLVADPGRQGVHWFDWARRRYTLLGEKREGGLPWPIGVEALPDGRILVSDARLGAVLAFKDDGRETAEFAGADDLERPAGLAVDPARGEVYVADVPAHQIKVFDLRGDLIRTLGQFGGGEGEFNYPTHIALGPEGHLYVMDAMNFRVQVLTPDGQFIRSIGRLGDAPGQFSKPKGLAVDNKGRLIAIEGLFSALLIFDAEGRLLLNLGGPGQMPGQFWLPNGLAFDRDEQLIFIADSYNGRVQVMRLLGDGE